MNECGTPFESKTVYCKGIRKLKHKGNNRAFTYSHIKINVFAWAYVNIKWGEFNCWLEWNTKKHFANEKKDFNWRRVIFVDQISITTFESWRLHKLDREDLILQRFNFWRFNFWISNFWFTKIYFKICCRICEGWFVRRFTLGFVQIKLPIWGDQSIKGENYFEIPIQHVKCTLMVLPIKQDYTGQNRSW